MGETVWPQPHNHTIWSNVMSYAAWVDQGIKHTEFWCMGCGETLAHETN